MRPWNSPHWLKAGSPDASRQLIRLSCRRREPAGMCKHVAALAAPRQRSRRRTRRGTMSRLPMPTDMAEFSEETRAAMRHILATRTTIPPPSSYLTYAGKAGALLSDLVEHLRYH